MLSPLIPAQAGIQEPHDVPPKNWVPAFAGTSGERLAHTSTSWFETALRASSP